MNKQKLLGLLKEMLKNSKRSDREIANVMGVSQPTVSRTRSRLDKEGYVKTYTVIPDFGKLGYEILAFTFTKMKSYPSQEKAGNIVQLAQEWVSNRPNIIFAADGEGLGKDVITISFHRNYSEYADFMRTFAMEWGEIISGFDSFLVSLESGYKMKPLDLKYLADDK
jgi:DNA-binding Lrp family transcriptional regulator